MLCKKLDLFGGELIGIDGSKFKAVNSWERNDNERKLRELIGNIDAKIKTYLEELDDSDEKDPPEGGKLSKAQLAEKIEQLQERKGDYEELSGQFDEEENKFPRLIPTPS